MALRAALICAVLGARLTAAPDVTVLSAAAASVGIKNIADMYQANRDVRVTIEPGTAAELSVKLAAGAVASVLVAPTAVLDQAAKDDRIATSTRFALGRVGVGVVIRKGAPVPDLSSVSAFEKALLEADGIVFSTGSHGVYVSQLLERRGLTERLQSKITRARNGIEVNDLVIARGGKTIGFTGISEILPHLDRGAQLVGGLPENIQNYTTYEAAVMKNAPSMDEALRFMAFLRTPAAKQALVSSGVR